VVLVGSKSVLVFRISIQQRLLPNEFALLEELVLALGWYASVARNDLFYFQNF